MFAIHALGKRFVFCTDPVALAQISAPDARHFLDDLTLRFQFSRNFTGASRESCRRPDVHKLVSESLGITWMKILSPSEVA